ncbi:MAG TPA: hypothetical protein PKW35_01700 [Nannocystaceae bacterium]|nr:hypothetical protein [Nannocystaceae bacterium]
MNKAFRRWYRGLQLLKTAPGIEGRSAAERELRESFDEMLAAATGDDAGWDEDDWKAWKHLQKLDEGEG